MVDCESAINLKSPAYSEESISHSEYDRPEGFSISATQVGWEKKYAVPHSYSLCSLRHMDTISSHESVRKILIHATGRWIGFELCIKRELKEEDYSKSESRSFTHQPDLEHRHCDITSMLVRFSYERNIRRVGLWSENALNHVNAIS